MKSERTYSDPQLGPVTIRKNSLAKRISIRVVPIKGVIVTIPRWAPYSTGEAFLTSRKDWAEAALKRMEQRINDAAFGEGGDINQGTAGRDHDTAGSRNTLEKHDDKQGPDSLQKHDDLQAEIGIMVERWREEARATLPARLRELAARYGFNPGRITIRHNRSNWGSCSSNGNINLNLNLVRLPKELQDYVMLHELCHLRHMDHGTAFHRLLEDLCRREMQADDMTDGNGRNIKADGVQLHKMLRKELKSHILL